MTQSFHGGASPATSNANKIQHANRRRTDLVPTVTPHSAGGLGVGSQMPSREISRASTPGRKMMTQHRSPGKAVSMSRLDLLSRPRVYHPNTPDPRTPSPSKSTNPLHAQQTPHLRNFNARRRDITGQFPSKQMSASMSQLNGPENGSLSGAKSRRTGRPPLSSSSTHRLMRKQRGNDTDEGRFCICLCTSSIVGGGLVLLLLAPTACVCGFFFFPYLFQSSIQHIGRLITFSLSLNVLMDLLACSI